MPYPAQAAFFRRRNGRRVDVMEFAVAVVRRTPDAFQSFASRRPAEGGVVPVSTASIIKKIIGFFVEWEIFV